MAANYHRHVALTEPLDQLVQQEVAEGRYASASEVVRAALRLLLERKELTTQAAGKGSEPRG